MAPGTVASLRLLVIWSLIALVYVIVGKLGMTFATIQQSVTLVWAPTGLALASVLLGGYRVWPGIALGAFVVNLSTPTPTPASAAFAIAVGNTLEALLGAAMLRRSGFDHSFRRVSDVLVFVRSGALLAPVVSATVGVCALRMAGTAESQELPRLWLIWWAGDSLGAILVAPLILTWASAAGPGRGVRHFLEVLGLATGLVAAGVIAFTWGRQPEIEFAVVLFPVVVCCAMRFGPREVVSMTVLAASVAVWGVAGRPTGMGGPPGAGADSFEYRFVSLHLFLGVAAVTSLLLAAAFAERATGLEELRQAASLLGAVTEGTEDALFVKDGRGRYLLFNEAAARFVGKPAAEVLGKDDTELFDPAGARVVMERDREVVATGRSSTSEEQLTAAGVTRTYSATKGPYRDERGRIVGVIGISRDITEQKSAEKALRSSEERFRALVEALPDAVFIKVGGRVVFCNPACVKLFGAEGQAELLGKTMLDLHPPQFHDIIRGRIAVVRDTRSPVPEIEEEIRRLDGRPVPVAVTALPFVDGGADGVLVVLRDLTERKRSEESLLTRDRAIGAASQGVVIADATHPGHPITYASPGFARLTGYAAEECVGRNCRFLQGKGTDRAAVDRIREALRAGTGCVVDLLNYRKDGSAFWNELSISPVRNERGDLSHFIGVMSDATERRKLEDQLRQSQKMDVVGQLAGGIAHDFNNLLTVINGFGDMALDRLPPDDPVRDFVVQMTTAGAKAGSLTRQLLTFSRKAVVTPEILDLNAVVAEMRKMLGRMIGENIAIETRTPPGLWRVLADAGQLEQIIMNLAVNARDAMPTGGSLLIETRNVESDEAADAATEGRPRGCHVMLAVSDNGHGMTAEVMEHIFEPFYTTKEVGKGTGLGLATVYGIVKQCGGYIEVDSEPGRGTSMRVYLPRAEQAAPAKKSNRKTKVAAPGVETVLLAEDEDSVRSLLRVVLTGAGYKVLTAADGDEALAAATRHEGDIHLLISDVVMPGVGGLELARRLADLRPRVKVLFLSGYTDDAVMRHGVKHRHVNFLQKPFSPAALSLKVREIIDAPWE